MLLFLDLKIEYADQEMKVEKTNIGVLEKHNRNRNRQGHN